MKVYLTMKTDRANAIDCAARVVQRLGRHDVSIYMAREQADAFPVPPIGIEPVAGPDEGIALCDAVVAVGGDGTIFHAAADAMRREKPVLGINAGRLGFLAQAEGNDLSPLDRFAAGDYEIERRLVLRVEVQQGRDTAVFYAVNDAVISKPDFGHVSEIEVRCGGDLVGVYRADGVIFATPTGSTAYSLSAGGPIADPAVDCMMMTPLASHSLVSRSIVFAGDKVLAVTTPDADAKTLFLTIDGVAIDAVTCGTVVTIRRAEYETRFVRLGGRSFYHILNEKMKGRG